MHFKGYDVKGVSRCEEGLLPFSLTSALYLVATRFCLDDDVASLSVYGLHRYVAVTMCVS